MFNSKRIWFNLLSTLLLILFMASSAMAVEINTGDTVNVPSGKIKGPLFVSGNNIAINADVDGDIFAAGQSVVINGTINGDVITAGNSVRINGNVLGDVRAAANTIDINGQIGGNLTGVANSISLREPSNIKRDALLFGNTVEFLGNVDGQALGSANQMNLNGHINGDIRVWNVEKLVVGPAAVINGMVTYNSANPAQIDVQAKVGKMTQLSPPIQPERNVPQRGMSWLGILWVWLAGILIWGAFYLIFPRLFPRIAKTALNAPWPTLGWGFLAMLLIPLAALVFMLTIIGIPLMFILIFAFIITLCLSKILVADLVSRYLVSRFKWEKQGSFLATFIITFLALIVITKLPILSFFLNVIIASMALGMLILTIYHLRGESDEIKSEPVIE